MQPERPKPIGYLDIPLRDIIIGERIREDYGEAELKSLQLNLELNGVLIPIIVDEQEGGKYHLIDGGRRLHCLKKMNAKTAPCRIFASLDEDHRREIELELCIKQKSLTYAEEARAVRDIVKRREQERMQGKLSAFGSSLRKKDIAKELNMSPASLSQCLTIAEHLDKYPQMELECTSKRQALTAIATGRLLSPSESIAKRTFEESFLVCTPLELVTSIQGKIVDLFILHPDTVDKELVTACIERLKIGGSIILFLNIVDLGQWIPFLKASGLYVQEQPYLWSVKGESRAVYYLWAGKNRDHPMRMLAQILTLPRAPNALSLKSKAKELIARIIKCCVERGAFVVVPDCQDIETLKTCYDLQVQVRASCMDKILRDRLLMNCGR